MTSDLSSATFITLVSMCILPLTASEAMVTSKRPRRSHPTSKFNSVTWITYVPMLLWPLNGLHDINDTDERTEEVYHPLTCVASPQVKIKNWIATTH